MAQHAVMRAIQQALRDRFGLLAARIHFAPVAAIPRTSTGKVSRARCRLALLAGDLPSAV
ncbi:MAG: hypothetical protein H7338_08980 [Candidatus Sericytochromatia bacterium]|nr:hypothetical protein [Candidatus Sericytochromatia bacterium]